MSFGLLYNFPPCFSIHSHLTPILKCRFSQILYDIISLFQSLSNNIPYCIWLFSVIISSSLLYPFLQYEQSHSMCFYVSKYLCRFHWQFYFLISSYTPIPHFLLSHLLSLLTEPFY